jgi:phospholysine phosphohistidine inorganic pyrophosphate phosphatase
VAVCSGEDGHEAPQGKPEQKALIVLEGLKGRPVGELCAEHEISQAQYYQWRDLFLANAARAFEPAGAPHRQGRLERENARLWAGGCAVRPCPAGLKIRHLTNTTTRSRRAIVERLRSMSVFVDPQHLFTPPAAACRFLERDGVQQIHLAAPSAFCEDFAVFELVEANPGAVVRATSMRALAGTGSISFSRCCASGARLVALHRNRYCRRESGISLDLGPFVAALEYAADIRADVVGKPARAFFDLALDDLGLDADEVVMVGDDIQADIGGAQNAGLRAIQVETGIYTPRDREHSTIRPDLVIRSAATLPAAIGMI